MRLVTRISAIAVLAIGGAVLVGWIFDLPHLKGPIPGLVQMKLNTSVGLIALSVTALLIDSTALRYRLLARLLASLAVFIGGVVLVEYVLGLNLGIDELIFRDVDATQTVHPGRLAPQTTMVFVLLGIASLLLTRRQVRGWLVDLMAGASLAISMFALLGYVYGTPALNQLPSLTPMALHTTIGCLLLSVSVIGCNRTGFLVLALTGSGAGSAISRRLLPLAILLVPFIGWLRLQGQQHGFYESETGVALSVITTVMIITAAVLVFVHASNRIDAERQRLRAAEHRLASLVEAADEAIFSLDTVGVVTTWNTAAERMYGYSADEIIGEPVTILHPPELAEKGRETLRKGLGGESIMIETRRQRKDGKVLDVKLIGTPIYEDGVPVGVCACTHDIGEQLHAKELLEKKVNVRTADLARSKRETLQKLALAAEFRDDDTARHTVRVGRAAASVALRLGHPARLVELIAEAAPLHDVGKIGIPDGILLKPGKLTAGEFETMKQHTVLGAGLLSGSESEVLRLGEEIALSHHERWDGQGYPNGLAGEAIPLAGRIVAVVDSYDAMTNDRPYKSAMSASEARSELLRCSGSQFDPAVVEAFLEFLVDRSGVRELALEEKLGVRPTLGAVTAGRAPDF